MGRWIRCAEVSRPGLQQLGSFPDQEGGDTPPKKRRGKSQEGAMDDHTPGLTGVTPSKTLGAAIILLTLVIALIIAFVR